MIDPKSILHVQAHTEGGGVLSSISSGLKSMAGRFTAPISGDEVTDRNVFDKASNSAQNTADTAAQKVGYNAPSSDFKVLTLRVRPTVGLEVNSY